jgi:hypothetical protein
VCNSNNNFYSFLSIPFFGFSIIFPLLFSLTLFQVNNKTAKLFFAFICLLGAYLSSICAHKFRNNMNTSQACLTSVGLCVSQPFYYYFRKCLNHYFHDQQEIQEMLNESLSDVSFNAENLDDI